MKNINVQTIKVDEKRFFKIWLTLLQPFLKLRAQELNVMASLLYYRYKIQGQVKNKAIIDELLFNTKTRKSMKKDMDMKDHVFGNTLTALRKKKLIVNNSLNSKLIPNVEAGFDNFKLVYNVEVKG